LENRIERCNSKKEKDRKREKEGGRKEKREGEREKEKEREKHRGEPAFLQQLSDTPMHLSNKITPPFHFFV